MTRTELLTTALDAVNRRPKSYGPPERNFERIARHWNVYATGKYGPGAVPMLDATDVACMMVLMKVARLEETPDHEDSWVDIAGYAACGSEVSSSAVIEHEELDDLEPAPRFKVGDKVRLLPNAYDIGVPLSEIGLVGEITKVDADGDLRVSTGSEPTAFRPFGWYVTGDELEPA